MATVTETTGLAANTARPGPRLGAAELGEGGPTGIVYESSTGSITRSRRIAMDLATRPIRGTCSCRYHGRSTHHDCPTADLSSGPGPQFTCTNTLQIIEGVPDISTKPIPDRLSGDRIGSEGRNRVESCGERGSRSSITGRASGTAFQLYPSDRGAPDISSNMHDHRLRMTEAISTGGIVGEIAMRSAGRSPWLGGVPAPRMTAIATPVPYSPGLGDQFHSHPGAVVTVCRYLA